MKITLSLIFLLMATNVACNAQNKNQFRIYYGLAHSDLLRNEELVGAGSYENENTYEFGFTYLRYLSKKLSLETGIGFFNADVKNTPPYMGMTISSTQEKLQLVSIPLYATYAIGKYFFINGGAMLDFHSKEQSFDSQYGIGFGFGVGWEYSFDNYTISINPNFKRHASIPFEKEKHHQRLTEMGVQISLGYKF